MFQVQGRLEAQDRFTPKDKDEMQVITLYVHIHNFGKRKPKVFDIFIPVSIEGLENHIDKTIIVPIVPHMKEAFSFNFSEDGRPIMIQNDKGEFVRLAKRPESLKPASQKVG